MAKAQASELLEKKSGELEFRLTNDYLFRIVFQENPEALKGLLAAILHINPSGIRSIAVENPIKPGDSIADKEYRMDILLTMNDNQRIDLEMQVGNYGDWDNRSLLYLSREYGNSLKRGGSYRNAVPVHQIGILDFDLFPDHPEFCGTYMMKNVEDGYTYNGNFRLTVVQLGQTEKATEKDIASGLTEWAKLFKSTTWEDLRMIAKNDEAMMTAANATAYYESDAMARKRMLERQDFLEWKAYNDRRTEELTRQLADKDARIKELEDELKRRQKK